MDTDSTYFLSNLLYLVSLNPALCCGGVLFGVFSAIAIVRSGGGGSEGQSVPSRGTSLQDEAYRANNLLAEKEYAQLVSQRQPLYPIYTTEELREGTLLAAGDSLIQAVNLAARK